MQKRLSIMTSGDVKVTVRYFAAARAAAKTHSELVTVGTVAELRALISKRHGPELARILPSCGLLIDGVTSHDELASLPHNATVDILPPFAGG